MSERSEALRERINAALDAALPSDGDANRLREAMRYSLLAGGKRLRAIMLVEFCELFGGSFDDAVDFACAVECVHAYSLIHDDLPCMDDDDLRRGRPTCHIAYGESTAMLAGDALLTYAFELMLRGAAENPRRAEAALVVARAAGVDGMCGGQVLDLENESRRADAERLVLTSELKTGALFSAACEAGAILGGADADGRAAAREYARGVGLAFQIEDDLLDVVGSAETFGKEVGADARRGKSTFASGLGADECRRLIRELSERSRAAISGYSGADELIRISEELEDRSF